MNDEPTPLMDNRHRTLLAKFVRKHAVRGEAIEFVGRCKSFDQVLEIVSVTPNRTPYRFSIPRAALPMLKEAIEAFEASCGNYGADR